MKLSNSLEVFLYGMRSIERIPNEIKSTYTFEFMIDNQIIHYHTTLNYDKSEIIYESLEQVTKTSKYIYFIRDGYDITIGDKLEKDFLHHLILIDLKPIYMI